MSALVPIVITRKVPAAPKSMPVNGWGIEAPVGVRALSFGVQGKDLAVLALLPAVNGVRVWHPLLILPIGGQYQPMLGRSFGAFLGMATVGPNSFAIFEDAPWPTIGAIPGVMALEGSK